MLIRFVANDVLPTDRIYCPTMIAMGAKKSQKIFSYTWILARYRQNLGIWSFYNGIFQKEPKNFLLHLNFGAIPPKSWNLVVLQWNFAQKNEIFEICKAIFRKSFIWSRFRSKFDPDLENDRDQWSRSSLVYLLFQIFFSALVPAPATEIRLFFFETWPY